MKKTREQRRREATEKRRKAQKILQRKLATQAKKAASDRVWFRRLHIPFSFSWKTVVVLSVFVGLIASCLTFLPRLSITSSESLNPATPFATPFIVTNDGNLGVYDVTFQYFIRRVTIADRPDFDISDNRVEEGIIGPSISGLQPNEKTTITCPYMLKVETPITRVDMDIVVRYQPSIMPFHLTKRFRFTTEMASDKKLHWFPRAGSE